MFAFVFGFLLGFFLGTLFFVGYIIAKLETHEPYLDDGRLVWREWE